MKGDENCQVPELANSRCKAACRAAIHSHAPLRYARFSVHVPTCSVPWRHLISVHGKSHWEGEAGSCTKIRPLYPELQPHELQKKKSKRCIAIAAYPWAAALMLPKMSETSPDIQWWQNEAGSRAKMKKKGSLDSCMSPQPTAGCSGGIFLLPHYCREEFGHVCFGKLDTSLEYPAAQPSL